MNILVDSRWVGQHGIGRFALQIIPRLRRSGIVLEELAPFPSLHPLEPIRLSWQIARRGPDVYFSPGFNPPLWSTAPFVFMIHDLIHLRFARDYGWRQRVYYERVVRPATRRASAVLTVSEFSQSAILDWAHVPESKVQVVSPGVAEGFSLKVKPLSLPYVYFLYVGNRKPHKNVPRLLEAFSRASLDPEIRLVLSGNPDRETAGLASRLGLGERVVFFGPVAEEDLPRLYRGAIALVFPSLLEGFGLPPLEAMACGTPVIISNSSSIPEVVGDAGLMVDPYDVEALANAMRRVLADGGLRSTMSARGIERAKTFSWDRAAEQVLGVLREAAGEADMR
jgi:glycosyltransferase involved in cell wall biosynthesis